jgi:hypothetical protein
MGSIGGMLIPWLQGVVLESFGPRSGALLFPLTALLMLAGLTTVRRPPGRQAIIPYQTALDESRKVRCAAEYPDGIFLDEIIHLLRQVVLDANLLYLVELCFQPVEW